MSQTMLRRTDDVPFRDRGEVDLGFATPRLGTEVSLRQHVAALNDRLALQAALLDRLDLGVVFVDGQLRIAAGNGLGQELLTGVDPLFLRHAGRLYPSDGIGQTMLERFAAASGDGHGSQTTTPPMLMRTSAGRCWVVYFLPLPSQFPVRRWAALSLQTGSRPIASIAALATLGALTKAEREVMELLVEGHTVPDIARRRGTRIDTVRSQVKSILHKIGVRRQSELIRMVAGLSLPLAMPEGQT